MILDGAESRIDPIGEIVQGVGGWRKYGGSQGFTLFRRTNIPNG